MPFLLLPNPGNEGFTATLIRWLVDVDDSFSPGQALAEFEAETGRLVVEAATSGRMAETLIGPGKTVEVGAKLARVDVAESKQESGSRPGKENAMSDGHAGAGG